MDNKIKASNVKLKRAYEQPAQDDGARIMVDRLWPRGVKKVDAALDEWAKNLAPSTELRKWFGHDPTRWYEFCARYTEEIKLQSDLIKHLRKLAQQGVITLVYSARDETHNDAVVLRNFLLGESIQT